MILFLSGEMYFQSFKKNFPNLEIFEFLDFETFFPKVKKNQMMYFPNHISINTLQFCATSEQAESQVFLLTRQTGGLASINPTSMQARTEDFKGPRTQI